jgi:hypothetical protein
LFFFGCGVSYSENIYLSTGKTAGTHNIRADCKTKILQEFRIQDEMRLNNEEEKWTIIYEKEIKIHLSGGNSAEE